MSNRQSVINLLTAMANSEFSKSSQHDIILNEAVNLIQTDKRTFDAIEKSIFGKGVTLGSNGYFTIRKLLRNRIEA